MNQERTQKHASRMWRLYKQHKLLMYTARTGVITCGCCGDIPADSRFFATRPESILEHSAGVTLLTKLLFVFYPQLVPMREREVYSWAALLHDLGEGSDEVGDQPDDGTRDVASLADLEIAEAGEFIRYLPDSELRSKLSDFICDYAYNEHGLTASKTIYALDKLEAVLQTLIYEELGAGGRMTVKRVSSGLSEQDQAMMDLAGNDSLADVWAVHFVTTAKNHINEEVWQIALAVLKAAVLDIRGEVFPWWERVMAENGD